MRELFLENKNEGTFKEKEMVVCVKILNKSIDIMEAVAAVCDECRKYYEGTSFIKSKKGEPDSDLLALATNEMCRKHGFVKTMEPTPVVDYFF